MSCNVPGGASRQGAAKSVFVETWGCQMNVLDGRRFVGLLARDGYAEAAAAEDADVVLLNTCSVRDKAEQKVYDRLGRLALLKRERPGLVLGVCGCVAQQEGESLLDRLPYVDFVLGTGRIEMLPAVVRRVREEEDRPCEIGFDLDEVAYTPGAIARTVPHRAAITVIEGCNKNCTFCVVPRTRGRERSRRLRDVVEESERLLAEGVVEVELLGQTVNAYRDPETGEDLADLLSALSALPGLRRLRFVTSHPRNFTPRLVDAMASSDAVCPALHLPVQSGSTRILARMKRQYAREDYVRLVADLRDAIPGIALSTDVIVGFPGETEEDFAETLSLLDEVRFAAVYSFTYSPRPQTAAARWPADLPPAVASARLARLMERQQDIQRETHAGLVGRTLEVLVEGADKSGARSSGRSACNRVVNIDAPRRIAAGTFVDVEIQRGLPNSLVGRPALL
ncbi:MAG TPA: tRNA (N6-isopentenyl adenosine(37)-C2)-methylthiotransferase MiaB [Thermoanaerobaculia bacterium]|nr:tRNA (N6-isopentenyl adenosine(37)-C2)-methylthiotransferase MiaB [Thermoanaerobaculia bacterium]